MTTDEAAYVAGFLTRAESDRGLEVVEALIAARLRGAVEPVDGLVSPPVGRNEWDETVLLTRIYKKTAQAPEARARLRRAAAQLTAKALHAHGIAQRRSADSPPDTLDDLTKLCQVVASFQVREDPDEARRLRTEAWGELAHYPAPPDPPWPRQRDLSFVRLILNLWLSATPPMCRDIITVIEGPQVAYLELPEPVSTLHTLFDRSVRSLGMDSEHGSEYFSIVLLLFRALLFVDPYHAGKSAFWRVCAPFDAGSTNDDALTALRDRWLSHAWEFGLLLERSQDKRWPKAFEDGLKNSGERAGEVAQQVLGEFGIAWDNTPPIPDSLVQVVA